MNFVKSDPKNAPQLRKFGPVPAGSRDFTFAHLSDPHLFLPDAVRLRDLLNKRMYGYLSWRLHRRFEHCGDVLPAMLEDIRSADPDHIVITGDLTHLALQGEFLRARALLRSLGPPSKVTVIPGNHDIYVRSAWKYVTHLWSDYLFSDKDASGCHEKSGQEIFPTLRIRNGVAFIGMSSARPTPPFLAFGSVGKTQLEKLKIILDETRHRGLLRVVLIHHSPVPGSVSRRKRLRDEIGFQQVLAYHGAELILYGHTHYVSSGHLDTRFGPVPAIGVPAISALGRSPRRRARYHLFRLLPTRDRVDLRFSVRMYSPENGRVVTESEQRVILPHAV